VDFLPKKTWFNRFKYDRARKVVCISQFIADQLRNWGVAPEKLKVIPSAVPIPASISPEAKGLRDRLGIASGKKIVGNIAALVGHKDQATLLRGAREVLNINSNVTFVIIGEGELRSDLERLRAELRLERDVHLTGFIPSAEQLLPAFDVFAMSSAMEGLGSIVLDAFAAGIPVASTAGGGLPELVKDAQTGRLVPAGDFKALAQAILHLLNDRSSAEKFAANARKFVAENFSVERMADRYLQAYAEVSAANWPHPA
jgi:glycosyltransferase involved in cell wall biosynthesis